MKVVYYTDQIYLHGGIERVLANKVNYLVNENDIETHIITSEQKDKPPCYHIDKRVVLHDLAINYNRKKSYLHHSNLKKTRRHYFLLKNKIKEINPDVIIVCNYAFDFYFIPFIYKNIIKIKEFHSSRYFDNENRKNNRNYLKKLYFKLNDYIESKYTYIVVLTEDEKKYYKSSNTVVVPNALTSYPESKTALDNKKVISAGRIAPVKGFEKLIESWVLVSLKHPNWVLEIYGDGDSNYVHELQNLINKLGLQKQVLMCGAVNNIEEKMLNASIYALTSKTECFPMVLLEALSCGLPVVSFDCPNGPRNIITNNEDGILVEKDNINEFASAIRNLINNKKLRLQMGSKGRENIKRLLPFSVMNIWLGLFKNN